MYGNNVFPKIVIYSISGNSPHSKLSDANKSTSKGTLILSPAFTYHREMLS